ncbi:type II toxin-antitoxin system HicA family toxin [Sinorhizobium meliloti]|uniref:type II toxin-antitoxin system HicA family toxin n=1 Tax=Rhizobium meliloti TaxID=382 RepID=UPI002D76E005|nr:type II toxin-antitoxin system HicA family toxin [Sinorhizobium meliloti]WRQ68600.1 type II toxin-antitoxin system HicA family toxin [Sinorhizobium meliloti]
MSRATSWLCWLVPVRSRNCWAFRDHSPAGRPGTTSDDLLDELLALIPDSPTPGSKSNLKTVPENGTWHSMKKCDRATLELIFARPVNGSIHWADIEALFVTLGAEVSEREGSRTGVFLFGEVRVFHRPHPSPDTDKGAVASIRKWLDEHGVKP